MSAGRSFSVVAFALAFALGAHSASAVEWLNLDAAHYRGGRKCSAGYLTGKVVLVCRDVALSSRMEEIWTGFKTKPFVLIGAYDRAPSDVSHPVYSGVALAEKSPETPLYVVDATSHLRYFGADEHRATEILVMLLTDAEAPKSLNQWRRFLDYEFASLPGHAYNRYSAFRKQFPEEAKDYADRFSALSKIPDVKLLAELVRFAKSVKDLRAIKPERRLRLKELISDAQEKYAPLKESGNPLVVREAKNALADLAWARAAL